MEQSKEINALLHLIEDPDEEVFGAVSTRIVEFGRQIVPNLENLWENTVSERVQERIELLIHRLHVNDLREDFRQWSLAGHHDLMVGALLAAKFQYPDLTTASIVQEVEKLRRNIWLELNNYLTPLEQVRIVTGILYGYYGLKGAETAYTDVNDFLLHKTLETRRGNQVGNGLLYLILCELLDIPVRAIGVPRQFILAYFKPGYSAEDLDQPISKIEFFIDPASGMVFTHKDLELYFKRIQVPAVHSYFRPFSNKRVIQALLEEMGKCFDNEKEYYKKDELDELSGLLD
ncbi:transglutaminase-like domain-containing protein [Flaviaesturariibacter terrae]